MGKYSDQILNTQAATPAPTTQGKYSSQIMGQTENSSRQPQQPQQEGWGEWIANTVRGRQDPNYKGVGSIYDQFTEDLRTPTANAAMAGASDPQMSDIVRSTLGDKVLRVEKDNQARDVFVTRGQNGLEQRGYLNEPGLDSTDVFRGIYGAVPYIASAGAIGGLTRGAGIVAQGLAQGAGAGATSLAGDLAQIPMGSQQGVDLEKAGANAALGAAGPLVSAGASALWRKFVTIPGMVDGAGKLTARGMQAAKAAGLDPNDLSPDMAKEFATSYAKSGDAALSAARSSTEPMGIPVTQGQQTKRPYLLNQEEKMRRGIYGDKAEREMLSFDALQRDRIEEATLGGGRRRSGFGETINPGSVTGRGEPQQLGRNVQEGLKTARQTAKQQESQLWEANGVRALEATPEALAELPDIVSRNLADVVVDSQVTPTAAAMAKEMDRFIAGKAPDQVANVLKQDPVKSVDQMRRRLLAIQKGAQTPEDGRAAERLYDSFNEWIGNAAEKSLLAGDPMAAAQLVKARAFSREVRQLFSPADASGRTSTGAKRLAKAMQNADSGEAVVQALLGPQGGRTASEGTATALRQAKAILDQFGGEGGQQAWNDIRLAYWTRIVQGKNGEVLGAQALTNNLKAALTNQKSMLMSLYSPEEISHIRRLMRAVEVAAYKPPNASGSGYTVTEGLKELTGKLLNLVPGSQWLRAGLEMSGVPAQVGAVRARAAMNQAVPVRRPNLTPAVTGAGSSQTRD